MDVLTAVSEILLRESELKMTSCRPEFPCFKPDDPQNKPIGYVIGGGLKANLFVRLTRPAQEVQEGGFVVLESGNWQFYGLVTDLQLGAIDPRYAEIQNDERLAEAYLRLLASQTLIHQPGGAAGADA